MSAPWIPTYLEDVIARVTDDGGFADHPEGSYRPDCTAWAIVLLQSQHRETERVQAACARLARDIQADGRLCIAPTHPDAIWPTPLAVIAWAGVPAYHDVQARAVRFLLEIQGVHWEKDPHNIIIGHDPSIPGWPWIMRTHAWVPPTALTMMALTVAGFAEHPRVRQGIRLLLNRQLPHGGWNYGNTTVWGQELRPFPETTGMALSALAGLVPREAVRYSLDYLLTIVPSLRTPLSLGWSLLGLAAWGAAPRESDHWIAECLNRQDRYGAYDTVALCILLAAALAQEGIVTLALQPISSDRSSRAHPFFAHHG